VVLGIPDFRVFPDPYIGIAEDHEKAGRIAQREETSTFAELLAFYWSITADTPPAAARRFVEYALGGAARGRALLDSARLETGFAPSRTRRFLEIGCRTGGLLLAGSAVADEVVGIDIAFRWLVVARRQLAEAGIQAQLVCCCAEHLPFPDGSFDVAVAESVLEHVPDPARVLHEAHRVLAPRGQLLATTWNRYSPAPEPHVRMFGVGYLPRAVARAVVPRLRRMNYDHVNLRSWFELLRAVQRSPFRRGAIDAPGLPAGATAALPAVARRLARVYERMRRWPGARAAIPIVAPTLRLRCERTPD
jgi:ubiquinone/menaquinone biosynthesis C-methylase UbiE